MAYNRNKGEVPEYFKSILVLNNDWHCRSTRAAGLTFLTPKYSRQTEGGRSFAVSTSKYWNSSLLKIRLPISANYLKHSLFNVSLDYPKEKHFTTFSSMFGV